MKNFDYFALLAAQNAVISVRREAWLSNYWDFVVVGTATGSLELPELEVPEELLPVEEQLRRYYYREGYITEVGSYMGYGISQVIVLDSSLC